MSASIDFRAEAQRIKTAVSIVALIGKTLALRRDGRHMVGLCPFHGERTPSFCVYDDGYHCFGCGAHGDAVDWLMATRRMTFSEAVRHLTGGGHVDRPHQPMPMPKAAQSNRSVTADVFMRCWDQGIDPAGTVVETYLGNRGGLSVPDGAPIRFHPRCQRGPRDLVDGPEFWPAMLALMTDPITGCAVGVHRTYLRPDGLGKAPDAMRVGVDGRDIILKAKRILGTWGVVRLAPEEEIGRAIGIAEGIENALTASQVIGWGPCWAAGTQDCIRNFPVLTWIEALTIFADADDSGTGLAAARACAARWGAAGREALIHIPPAGHDWNDVAARIAA